ncbi:DNA methylase [Candidatus Poribacteria bacterium]|nr:DNA methylase [Candidatus Poribacteria bacterium]
MAESPAHKFGQLIGNLLEELVEPFLADFASKSGLYLDYQKKPRPARRGKKVTWEDPYGNVHDLDYVLERDGTEDRIGTPVAFVEVAWRRYTKHSRNKAQEIQGAVLPIAEKHQWSNPFLGAVLAGEFTDGSIEQLSSLGFHVIYFPYETITRAFLSQGMNAAFDESTPIAEFRKRVKAIENAPVETMQEVKRHLGNENRAQIYRFLSSLNKRLARMIERIVVMPLYGRSNEFDSIDEALSFIDHHSAVEVEGDFRRYEVQVLFSNGDKAEGSFKEKEKVLGFLKFVANQ